MMTVPKTTRHKAEALAIALLRKADAKTTE